MTWQARMVMWQHECPHLFLPRNLPRHGAQSLNGQLTHGITGQSRHKPDTAWQKNRLDLFSQSKQNTLCGLCGGYCKNLHPCQKIGCRGFRRKKSTIFHAGNSIQRRIQRGQRRSFPPQLDHIVNAAKQQKLPVIAGLNKISQYVAEHARC